MTRPKLQFALTGYLLMDLRGSGCDAVLQSIQREGVSLYQVRRHGQGISVGISLADFGVMYRLCRTHQVKIRFLQRSGAPFMVRRARRRKSMLLGAFLFLCTVYGLGSVVWQVNVSGVDEDMQSAVLAAARDAGLHTGALKSHVPALDAVGQAMMRKIPDLMWVGVDMQGTRAVIHAVEKVPGVKLDPEQPRNVIAGKPAVVQRILATRGQVLVKPGQTVHPGDVLISGDLGQGKTQVPATGKVFGEVWYTSRVEVPLNVSRSELTGAAVQRDYLVFGGLKLHILGWKQPQYRSTYDRAAESDWHIGTWRLPIQVEKLTVYETKSDLWNQTIDEAGQAATRLAAQDVQRQTGEDGVILGQKVLQRQVAHGKLYETVMTRTEEDIGVPAPIPKTPERSD